MRNFIAATAVLFPLATSAVAAPASNYLDQRPLSAVITTPVAECTVTSANQVPVIAWGADIATSLGNGSAKRTAPGSIFAAKGLDLNLYRQDNFPRQVADYMACKTPFIRGTMGMLAQAAEVFARDPRTAPVLIHQLSWSAGGDVLVVKEGIRSPKDLKGKTIVVQAYGPHVDYMLKILSDAGLTSKDVTIKWTNDIIDTGPTSFSPGKALLTDSSVDAAFVISPDAAALTSGGKVGTGAEGSVRGAHILLSTKTANRIIVDVYAVRSDYFNAHRAQMQAFTSGLLVAEEQLRGVMKAKGPPYQKAISAAAQLLLDSPTAINDTAGMYGDLEMAGFRENVRFFGDPNYPRRFDVVTGEIAQSLIPLGLLSKPVSFAQAKWDYASLIPGLTDTKDVVLPRFDTKAVEQLVQTRARQNDTEGVLFTFEIYFGANQNDFPAEQYQKDFDRAIELVSTYGGALLTVEGHSDPLAYLQQKKNNATPFVLDQVKQAARNLSYTRANKVKDNLIVYGSKKSITLDASQFGVIGYGVSQPNTPRCTHGADGDITIACAPATQQEWNATRRVTFKIIQVEAEQSVFKPLQ
ncbi:MAG: ABC transporter substrate-binding protein [bacterium]|nr:ABC transporter substrate-binding protein [bacterium]